MFNKTTVIKIVYCLTTKHK